MPNDRLSDNMGRLARAVEALYPSLSKIAGDNGGKGAPDPGIGEDGRVRPSGGAAGPGKSAAVWITVAGGSAEAVKAAPGLAEAMAAMKSVGAGGPAAFERSAVSMARAMSALAGPSGIGAGAVRAAARTASALAGVKDPKADLSWIGKAADGIRALAGAKDPKADLSWLKAASETLAGVKDPKADLSWAADVRRAAAALAGADDPGVDVSWLRGISDGLAGIKDPKVDLSWVSVLKGAQKAASGVKAGEWAGLEAAAGSVRNAAGILSSTPPVDLSGLAAELPDGLRGLAAAGRDGSLDGLAAAGSAIGAFAGALVSMKSVTPAALAGLRGIRGDELDGLAALSRKLSAAGSASAAARNISALAGAMSGISADPASAARSRRAINAVFREIGRIRIDPAAADALKKVGSKAGEAVEAMAKAAAALGSAEVPAGAGRKARRIGRVFKEIGAAAKDMAAGLTAKDVTGVRRSAEGYETFIRLTSGLSLRLTAAALLAPAAVVGAAALRLELAILGKHIKEIASMSADNDNAAKNIKAMTGFVLALGGLTALTAGVALVIDGKVIGAIAAEAALCGMLIGAMKLILTISEKEVAAADRNVRSMSVLAGTLTAMTAGIAAASWISGSGHIMATIGVTAAAAGMLIGTAWLLSRIDGMDKAEKGAEALALFSGSMLAVTAGVVVLSKAVASADAGALIGTIGMMTVIGAALIGAAALMAKPRVSDGSAVKGAAAMALFAAASAGMMTAVVLLSKISGFDEGGGSKIWQTVLLMTAVTGIMAGTAFLVSRFGLSAAPGALVGIAALGMIGFGMVFMTKSVMSISEKYDGKKVWSTFGLMAAVTAGVIGIGALLAAAAPVTLAALAGGLAFLAVSAAITGGIRSITKVRSVITENGLDKPDGDGKTWITTMIKPVLDETMGLFAGIDMPVKMSAVRKGKRAVMKVVKALDGIVKSMVTLKKAGIGAEEAVGYAAGMKTAVSGFMAVVTDMLISWEKSAGDGLKIHRSTIKKQKKTLKNVGRLVSVTRGLMKIIRDFDKDGKDGRNMIDSAAENAAVISGAVLSFTTAFFAGDEFENAIGESFRRTRRSLKMVNRLIKTSSKFMSMMNGIGDKTRADMEKSASAGEGTEFEAKGRQISDALLRFTTGFFGGMASLDKTVDDRMRAARKPLKNLRRLVAIVPNFLGALQKYTDMTSGEDGKPTADDLMANAESLAAIVTSFTSTLFGKFQELSEPGTVKKNIKNLRRVVKPVTSLVEMLASYDSGDGETLARVSVVNGKIEKTGTVNVANVSKAIISAVTLFLRTMYAKENIDRWNELSGRELNRGAAVFGKLGVVIEPITAFTEMLLKFKDGGLIDKDGKVQPIEPVGAAIAGTVVNFLNTLYSDDNKRMWKNMSKMSAEDGRSALSSIIDPVESFVKMVAEIGAGITADGVMTVKSADGAERKVNMPSIARQLSGGFKAFADAVEGAADPKKSKTVSKAIEKSAASVAKAFKDIDGVLAKSKNDSRVAELRRLTEEIQKLAESVDKIDMEKIKEQVELLKTQTALMQAETQREYVKKGPSAAEQVDDKFGSGNRAAGGGNTAAEQPKVTPAVIDPAALAQAFVTAMSNSPWTMTVIDDKNIMFTVDGE